MAQLIECLTLAQVMISQFVDSSPALGFALKAQARSLLQILCFSLSLPLPDSHPVSLSLSFSLSQK